MADGSRIILKLCKVQGIALTEQDWTKHGTHLSVTPMLAEDVRCINGAVCVVEFDHLGCNRLAHVVVGQGMMPLGKSGVGDGPTLYH